MPELEEAPIRMPTAPAPPKRRKGRPRKVVSKPTEPAPKVAPKARELAPEPAEEPVGDDKAPTAEPVRGVAPDPQAEPVKPPPRVDLSGVSFFRVTHPNGAYAGVDRYSRLRFAAGVAYTTDDDEQGRQAIKYARAQAWAVEPVGEDEFRTIAEQQAAEDLAVRVKRPDKQKSGPVTADPDTLPSATLRQLCLANKVSPKGTRETMISRLRSVGVLRDAA